VKTLVHQFVNFGQLVWPDYGVGYVLLGPGGHVSDGPDLRTVLCICKCVLVGPLSEH
jgi:hypothetical protein